MQLPVLHGFWSLFDLPLAGMVLAGSVAASIILAFIIWFGRQSP
jgi:hypothetical protein